MLSVVEGLSALKHQSLVQVTPIKCLKMSSSKAPVAATCHATSCQEELGSVSADFASAKFSGDQNSVGEYVLFGPVFWGCVHFCLPEASAQANDFFRNDSLPQHVFCTMPVVKCHSTMLFFVNVSVNACALRRAHCICERFFVCLVVGGGNLGQPANQSTQGLHLMPSANVTWA